MTNPYRAMCTELADALAAWLYSKDRNCQAERDAAKWTIPLQSDKP